MKRKRSARCRLGWAWLRGAARSSAGDPRGDTGGHRPAEVGFTEDCGGEQRCVHRGAQSPCGGEGAWLPSPRPPPPPLLVATRGVRVAMPPTNERWASFAQLGEASN